LSFIQALQQNELVKVLAEPTLVAVSGRPAYFMDGGKVPYPVVSGLGSVNVAFQDFGTQVDFVPIILGNGKVRLEVRPSVSEVDNSLAVTLNGTTVPGFTTRTVDTGVELKMGQTLALAGLIQQRVESTRNSIPVLGDLPFVGALFRRMTDNTNEVELLILVRPELAEGIDCDQVPPTAPGENTEPTSDFNFYINGQIEQPPQPRGAGPNRTGGINAPPGGAIGFGPAAGPPAGPGMADPLMVNPPGTNGSTPSAFGPALGWPPGAIRSEPVPTGAPLIGPTNELPIPAPSTPAPPSLPPSARVLPSAGVSSGVAARRAQPLGVATREPAGASAAASSKYVAPPAATGSYNPPQMNSQQYTSKKPDGELPGFIGSSGYDVSN
jgi:pilus assembly protein CpaC